MQTAKIGALAEEMAACFLTLKRYRILARGYRSRGREIDIVAERDGCVVFVEVKCRLTSGRGLPREAVDRRKRGRIVFAARAFLAERGLAGGRSRFDVVEVRLEGGGRTIVLEHLVGAFRPEPRAGRW